MSDDDYTLDQDNDSDLVKQLRKQLRDKENTLKALSAENETFKTTVRKSTVAELLAKRNVNPKVAAFIPADVEANDEAIGKWLADYGDVFGVTTSTEPQGQESQPGVSPDLVRQLAQVQQTSQDGVPVDRGAQQQAYEKWLAAAANAKSVSELTAFMNANPPGRV